MLPMSRVEEIRQAIATLTLEEKAELMSSLAGFEDDEESGHSLGARRIQSKMAPESC